MITKAVVPVAGLGTRLLSVTKEQPKEMLPVFASSIHGDLAVKPLVQMIFEQLCGLGMDEFCFVVGRGKRAIVDHFTPDSGFIKRLARTGRLEQAEDLEHLYHTLDATDVTWVNQPEPLGFGHSLLMAESFVQNDHFIVHAGDTYIIPHGKPHVTRLVDSHLSTKADATLLLARVPPAKGYGFAVIHNRRNRLDVRRVVEKPLKPPSDLAIMPIYAFSPAIMGELKKVKPGVGGEIQLTDGIQRMIQRGYNVNAVLLSKADIRLDIGTPQTYWNALRVTRLRYRRMRSR